MARSADSCCCILYMRLSDYGVNGNTFKLEKATCNHGFFMMAPNHWDTLTKTFTRPLRLTTSLSVTVSVSKPPTQNQLLLKIHHATLLSPEDQHAIKAQVARMFRLSVVDENAIQEFHKLHLDARNQEFGRLFRSPSLFEDIVKTLLLCNCNWQRSLEMAKALCKFQYELDKGVLVKRNGGTWRRKQRSVVEACSLGLGNFPSCEEIALLSESDELNKFCNLGYRARFILRLAQHIVSGKLQLQKYEMMKMNDNTKTTTQIMASLQTIKGVSKFASANIMMCLGYYQFIPCDTETIRHLKEFHGIKDCCKTSVASNVKMLYEPYSPFNCLAYWFELVKEYERQLGKSLSELKNSEYICVTGKKS
nr:DNA-3-methyladenine glycosylase [Ipomoea batatas]